MKKIILPLALLASIATLTSCSQKTDTPDAVVPVSTSVETPVSPDVMPVSTGTTDMAPAEPTTMIDTTVAPISRNETVTYATPAGNDSVEFSITITDGVITQAEATPKSNHDISKKMQTWFAAAVSTSVVGKKISDLDTMSAIGGASLTTGAFKTFVQAM